MQCRRRSHMHRCPHAAAKCGGGGGGAAANGGGGAGGAAGAAGGDGGGPALVLACNCMEDAAGAAHGWKKPFKLCWPCLALLPVSRCFMHAATCLSLLPLLSHCLRQYRHSKSSILTLLASQSIWLNFEQP